MSDRGDQARKADVYRDVADPKFTQVPMAGLLSKSYAESRRALIEPRKAMSIPPPASPARFGGPATAAGAAAPRPAKGPRFDDHYETERDTTSFSIVDQYGNAVSCTPTLGGGFGAGVVVGNTGLLLNNGDRLGSSSPTRQRELRARRADSAAQQLADDCPEGRQGGDGVRHARR